MNNTIKYDLRLKNGSEYSFVVDLDRDVDAAKHNGEEHPEWTRLEVNQCSNCPLKSEQVEFCPAAIDIENLTDAFGNTLSIERADVWVTTRERSFYKNCDAQTFLKSIYGLVMASGACPILSRLKPLAHFHLPFATIEETVYRLVGSYLVNQYIQYRTDGEPDWELHGIEELYKELRTVNMHLMRRIRIAAKKDASINAVQSLLSITSVVGMGVDDILMKLRPVLNKGL